MARANRIDRCAESGARTGRSWRRVGLFLLLLVSFAQPAPLSAEPIELGKGLLLIAEPTLRDPNFRETVILITHHDAGGTMGVIINRPTATPLSDLLPDLAELEGRSETLSIGGPVERNVLVVLVRMRSRPEHAHRVFDNVYVTQSTEVLRGALQSGDPTARVRMFAGYAGWAPGQLEREIADGGWRIAPVDSHVVFDRDADVMWKEMIRRTSDQYI